MGKYMAKGSNKSRKLSAAKASGKHVALIRADSTPFLCHSKFLASASVIRGVDNSNHLNAPTNQKQAIKYVYYFRVVCLPNAGTAVEEPHKASAIVIPALAAPSRDVRCLAESNRAGINGIDFAGLVFSHFGGSPSYRGGSPRAHGQSRGRRRWCKCHRD